MGRVINKNSAFIAYTDDKTIAEMLAEDKKTNYKFPYTDEFVAKHVLRSPANTGITKK